MNIQNAKELTIEEGSVRTITDSHGNQLWGKVNYSVKYGGDTTQQTYSGKNLVNLATFEKGRIDSGVIAYAADTSNITVSGDSLSFTTTKDNRGILSAIIAVSPSTAYTFSGVSTTVNYRYVDYYDNNGNWLSRQGGSSVFSDLTVTTPNNCYGIRLSFRLASAGTGTLTNIQFEQGSAPTSYEPYVGGTASPNPDYPQTVNVVTGLQSIRISDVNGLNSKTFLLDLGTTELCKIGTYQDYIYKSGGNWYVHREINKSVFNGSDSENWGINNSSTPNWYYQSVNAFPAIITGDVITLWSNYGDGGYVRNGNTDEGIMSAGGSCRIRYGSEDTINNWKTKLSITNLYVYYPITSATDIQITDATLIAQLEAINEWCTRYGYSFTVEGNVHILINQTII